MIPGKLHAKTGGRIVLFTTKKAVQAAMYAPVMRPIWFLIPNILSVIFPVYTL